MAEKLTSRLLTPRDRDALDALWHRSAERFLVQRPDFVRHSTVGEASHLGVFRRQDLVLSVAFSPVRHRGSIIWMPPLFTPFSGPVVGADEKRNESFWRDSLGLLHKAIPKSVASSELICPPGLEDVRGLIWKGWEVHPHYNYVTEWEGPGEWEAFPESTVRRQARKAREAGLGGDVLPAGQTEELERLWCLNAPRQNLRVDLAANLGRLGRWLESEDAGFQVVIRDPGGAPHAIGLFGMDERRVYYLAGASDPNLLGSGGATLLHYEAFAEIERRCLPHCYDWVGANTPSVAQFKKKFHPRLELLLSARRFDKKTQIAQVAQRLLHREKS